MNAWWGRVACVLVCLSASCVLQPDGGKRNGRMKAGAEPLRIGVIVPLSGQHGVYGRAVLQGAECGAGLKSPCEAPTNVELVSRDSLGQPARAAEAVRELAGAEKVAAIVGPLMSVTVMEAAQESERLGIPMISLSQRGGVAEVGPHIYRLAMDGESQINAIARYAFKEANLQRFAILYPNNKYGRVHADLFRSAITTLGGTIVVERSYTENLAKLIEAKQKAEAAGATGVAPGPMRVGRDGVVEIDGTAATATIPTLASIHGVDAIFIPDSYRTLVAMVAQYGKKLFGGAKLVGVNRWNNAGILAAGSAVEGAIFVDGFFKDSANVPTQRFVSTFTQAYGITPTVLEAQAYDAVQMVAEVAGRTARSPAQVQQALQRLKRFRGVTGGMTMTASGSAQKELFILTVSGGRIAEVGQRQSTLAHLRRTGESLVGTRVRAAPNEKYDVGGAAARPTSEPEHHEKYDDDGPSL